jgi:hypothetical protein
MGNARRKVVALGLAAALSTGGGIAAVTLTASSGAAAIGTHKITLRGASSNFGGATENSAVMKFQCNDATGRFNISVKGVQVIGSDHVTPWDTTSGDFAGRYWVHVTLFGESLNHIYTDFPVLSQDAKAGLFTLTKAGTLPDVAACRGGSGFIIDGGSNADTNQSLYMLGNLT